MITENRRVDDAVVALAAGDLEAVGEILAAGHASLRDDFEVSTPLIDELVAHLLRLDGVRGARLCGGGFGGCVIALCRPGVDPTPDGLRSWDVRPSGGARID